MITGQLFCRVSLALGLFGVCTLSDSICAPWAGIIIEAMLSVWSFPVRSSMVSTGPSTDGLCQAPPL